MFAEWFKTLFKKTKTPTYIIRCPKCGSLDVSSFTTLANLGAVISDTEEPKYNQVVTCANCGFNVISGPDEDEYAAFDVEEVPCSLK